MLGHVTFPAKRLANSILQGKIAAMRMRERPRTTKQSNGIHSSGLPARIVTVKSVDIFKTEFDRYLEVVGIGGYGAAY